MRYLEQAIGQGLVLVNGAPETSPEPVFKLKQVHVYDKVSKKTADPSRSLYLPALRPVPEVVVKAGNSVVKVIQYSYF